MSSESMREKFVIETWKPVKGYKGYYSVSSLGRVRRDKASVGTRIKILKTGLCGGNYHRFTLHKNGIAKAVLLHRVIIESFIGKCPKGKEVNHIDGNRLNNSINNLEYVTSKENNAHARNLGLWDCRGSKCGKATLTDEQVLSIRNEYSDGKVSQRFLARKYKTTQANVWDIIHGNTWKALKLAGHTEE